MGNRRWFVRVTVSSPSRYPYTRTEQSAVMHSELAAGTHCSASWPSTTKKAWHDPHCGVERRHENSGQSTLVTTQPAPFPPWAIEVSCERPHADRRMILYGAHGSETPCEHRCGSRPCQDPIFVNEGGDDGSSRSDHPWTSILHRDQ